VKLWNDMFTIMKEIKNKTWNSKHRKIYFKNKVNIYVCICIQRDSYRETYLDILDKNRHTFMGCRTKRRMPEF
jgi:hypothetical protein